MSLLDQVAENARRVFESRQDRAVRKSSGGGMFGDDFAKYVAEQVSGEGASSWYASNAQDVMLKSVATAQGGLIGINDYGFKGKRQYIADRRYLLDLYVIATNNADIRTATTHLRNEIFRRGIEWEAVFDYRCVQCGNEHSTREAKKMEFRCKECGVWTKEEGGTKFVLDEKGKKIPLVQGPEGQRRLGGKPVPPPLVPPDPEQKKVFETFMTEANYFGQSIELVLRECTHPSTLVRIGRYKTKRMDQVKVGDEVVGHSGYWREVLAVKEIPFEGELTVLELEDGARLRLTDNHPLLTKRGWVAAGDMAVDDMLLTGVVKPFQPPQVLACAECGTKFTPRNRSRNLLEPRWCSNSCSTKAQMRGKDQSGDRHWAWKGDRVERRCDGPDCDKILLLVPGSTRRWCSPRCRARTPRVERVEVTCAAPGCGVTFKKRVTEVGRQRRFYCSRECTNHGVSFYVRGEDHWAWQGGGVYRDQESLGGRDEIREFYGYRCQSCNVHQDDLAYSLDVHHVDRDPHNNSFENRVALGRSCHRRLHAAAVREGRSLVPVANGIRVVGISREPYRGLVYNLEVDEDETYQLGNAVISHNCEDDINVVDDAFMYLRPQYTMDKNDYNRALAGEDVHPKKTVTHVLRLDPVLVEYDLDYRGIPGMRHHVCVFHRDNLLEVPADEGWDLEWQGVCPDCGLETYPVLYKYNEQYLQGGYGSAQSKVLYLLRDEVIHWNYYTPCYDLKTEVMTRRGWKLIVDVGPEDEVATRTQDGYLEWHCALNKFVIPYDGKMWRAKTQTVDLTVTPAHKLLVRGARKRVRDEGSRGPRQGSKAPMHMHEDWPRHPVGVRHHDRYFERGGYDLKLDGELALVPADEIQPNQSIYMAKTALWRGHREETFTIPGYSRTYYSGRGHTVERTVERPARQVLMNDWLEFMGYYLAEGTRVGPKAKNFQLTQSISVNPDTARRMRECLDRLEIHWSGKGDRIYCWDPAVREYLRKFGYSRDRFIPEELKELVPEQLSVLLDALIDGDGHRDEQGRPVSYVSVSKRLLEDTAEIAIKCGWPVNFEEGRCKFGGRRSREPRLDPGTYGVSYEKMTHAAVAGLEVPNHVMLVRRNGKTVWSGNSELYGYPPILSIYEKALTLIGMDRYLYDYFYERRVPQGIIATTTDDPEGLNRTKAEVEAKMQQDPHYIPWVAISNKTQAGRTEFVRFAYSLDELNYLPVRDEIRERISGMFGVSNIWMADSSGGGGLNNESLQLKVMERVTEGKQRGYHEDVFPLLVAAFGITHWRLKLRVPEESSEMAEIQIERSKAELAQIQQSIGFGIRYDPETQEYDVYGEVKPASEQQQQEMLGTGLPGGGKPGNLGGGGEGGGPPQQKSAGLNMSNPDPTEAEPDVSEVVEEPSLAVGDRREVVDEDRRRGIS